MGIQIFGTKKCPDTKKAERFFKERGVPFQSIDLAQKGVSDGELKSIAAAVGPSALVDVESRRFLERGLAYQDYDAETEIRADPLLLKTPVVRDGRKATVGYVPDVWTTWLKG
jgi:arsenate reductase (glutaredoxin)